MQHILKTAIASNTYVGLCGFATDTFCLVGFSTPQKTIDELKNTLQVPVYPISIAGTALVGVFVTGTKDLLLVPHIIYDDELVALKKILPAVQIHVVDSRHTALANIFCVHEKAILYSKVVEQTVIDELKKIVSQPLLKTDIADCEVPGSCIAFGMQGALIHPVASDSQLDEFEKLFGVAFTKSTVNWGSPYVKTGIISNKYGFVIGQSSSGPEVQNADLGLGFVR
jgi:translation initiation factor 6